MNRDLFLAILGMDSYDRRYRNGLFNLPVVYNQTKIGNATIIADKGDDSAIASSFYAIAYELNGERIISYRGTDDTPRNALSGFRVGVGSATEKQAQLAVEFYNAVLGSGGGDPRLANIALTGHSMGGGLAGFVGSLYNRPGVLFDNMAFELAARHAYEGANAASPPLPWLR